MTEHRLTIPPSKDALIVSVVCIIGTALLVFLKVEPYLISTTDPWFLFVLAIICCLCECRNYILTSDRIVCRYFFIPYRRINWRDISDAVFFNEWNDLGSIKKEHVLLITLKPCRPYDARLYSIFSYRLNFPRKTLFIYLSKEQVDSVVQIFQDHLDSTQFRDMRK